VIKSTIIDAASDHACYIIFKVAFFLKGNIHTQSETHRTNENVQICRDAPRGATLRNWLVCRVLHVVAWVVEKSDTFKGADFCIITRGGFVRRSTFSKFGRLE